MYAIRSYYVIIFTTWPSILLRWIRAVTLIVITSVISMKRCSSTPVCPAGKPKIACVITSYSIHYTKLYDTGLHHLVSKMTSCPFPQYNKPGWYRLLIQGLNEEPECHSRGISPERFYSSLPGNIFMSGPDQPIPGMVKKGLQLHQMVNVFFPGW